MTGGAHATSLVAFSQWPAACSLQLPAADDASTKHISITSVRSGMACCGDSETLLASCWLPASANLRPSNHLNEAPLHCALCTGGGSEPPNWLPGFQTDYK